MSGKTLLVLGLGLLISFGLTHSTGAGETALERPELVLATLNGSGNVGQDASMTIGADGLRLIS